MDRLARDLDREKLAAMTRTIELHEVPAVAEDVLEGTVRGRLVGQGCAMEKPAAGCPPRMNFLVLIVSRSR